MPEFQLNSKDLESLKAAIARNPQRVRSEVGKFLVRGMAVYNRGVIRNPWRVGSGGGGAPVATGNLRDTHRREISVWEARIGPDPMRAPYAKYVHGIDGYPRRGTYELRPWLDWVFAHSEPEIMKLEGALLDTITADLAS